MFYIVFPILYFLTVDLFPALKGSNFRKWWLKTPHSWLILPAILRYFQITFKIWTNNDTHRLIEKVMSQFIFLVIFKSIFSTEPIAIQTKKTTKIIINPIKNPLKKIIAIQSTISLIYRNAPFQLESQLLISI